MFRYLIKSTFFLFFFFYLTFARLSFAQINVKQDFSVVSYSVSGNESRSFFSDDTNRYLYEGSLEFNDKSKSGGGEFYGSFFYRATDDPLVDPERLSVEQFTFGYRDKTRDLVIGDFFAGFSTYSVSNALKGIKFESKIGDVSKFFILSGVDVASWESIWGDGDNDTPKERYVWAARYETGFLDNNALIFGCNYGAAVDDHATFSQNDVYKKIHVASTDIKYQLNEKIVFNAEVAKSFSEARTGSELDYKDKWDGAYKASIEFRDDKYFSSILYSRVDPHFESTGGFSSQDLETVQINNNINFSNGINCSPYFFWSRDNLGDTKETTTKTINPGINCIWPLKDNWSVTGGWDGRKDYKEDDSSQNTASTFTVGLNKAFKRWSSSLNYSRAYMRNNANDDQERDLDNISLGLNGSINIDKTYISWNAGENLSLDKNLFDKQDDVLWSHSAGINIAFPHDLNLAANINYSDNDFYKNENDSRRYMYALSINKSIKDNLKASLDYSQNDNMFMDEANDYSEMKIAVKLHILFKKD